jgi:hypothetical protein
VVMKPPRQAHGYVNIDELEISSAGS